MPVDVGRALTPTPSLMPRAPRAPEWGTASQFGQLSIRARPGTRAVTIQLKPGLYLVSEVPDITIGVAPLIPIVMNAASAAIKISKKGLDVIKAKAAAEGMTTGEYLKSKGHVVVEAGGKVVDKGRGLVQNLRDRRADKRADEAPSVPVSAPTPTAPAPDVEIPLWVLEEDYAELQAAASVAGVRMVGCAGSKTCTRCARSHR